MLLPFFPLQLIVYPGERLPLHIFEKRYQQLIDDCEERAIRFGVPTYIDETLEYGTEVRLLKVAKRYPDGESDVICVGTRIFKIKNFIKQLPGKLYAGGEVVYVDNIDNGDLKLQEELLKYLKVLYAELDIDNPPVFETPFLSYQVAHKIGLALNQEYHLLKMPSELERLNYILGHLKVTIPVLKEMNRAKAMIKLNGHFKNFDPLDFENLEL